MKAVRNKEQLLAAALFVAVCVLFSLAHQDSKKLDGMYKKVVVQHNPAPAFTVTSQR